MREQYKARFVSTCHIERRSEASNGRGGITITWTRVKSNLPCQIEPSVRYVPKERDDLIETTMSLARWTLALAVGTDIRKTDRVISGGKTFEVEAVGHTRTNQIYLSSILIEQPTGAL
jgi:hypothetical protein